MGLRDAAIVLATVIALVLFIAYLVKRRRERGDDPKYAEEVYLYLGPPTATRVGIKGVSPTERWASTVARRFGASVASVNQVELYLRLGGHEGAGWATAGGGPGPAKPRHLVRVGGGGGGGRGVWLYGPKPRSGTAGVMPFGRGWFQQ